MLDLNVLVPPSSDLTLADVEKINDRGEMFGNAALPNGDARAFLLIPCDENHPSVEGCDYSLLDPSAATSVRPGLRPPASGDMPLPGQWHRNNRLRFPAFGHGN